MISTVSARICVSRCLMIVRELQIIVAFDADGKRGELVRGFAKVNRVALERILVTDSLKQIQTDFHSTQYWADGCY